MTFETSKKLLDYFPEATHLSLAGFGEPLLVADLFEIITESKKRPMRISIITNGTLLAERIEDMAAAGFHRVSISMNSLSSNDYQSTCGGSENTFSNVIKGIELLVKRRKSVRPYIHLSFVLMRDLFDQAQDIIRFAEDARVDYLDLHNLIPHDKGADYEGVLTVDDEEVVRRLSEWRRRNYTVQVRWPRLIKRGLGRPARPCNSSWDWLGIDLEGNTAGCSKAMPTKRKYGNLFEEEDKVWNNEFRKSLRAGFLKKEFLYDCCKTCTEVQP
jgi:MoaA/NifB/PqqE/SkfB family radical SAM enzyme